MAEDEMVRVHHGFNGHEFEETLGDSEGWRSLTFCSPWGFKESNNDLVTEYNRSANSVQSLSGVQLFVSPWTAALQASVSITNSQSLFKLMSIESAVPSNHLILC